MSLQSMLRRALTFNHLSNSVLPSRLRGRRPYASNSAAAAEEPNPDGSKVRGRRLSKKEFHALVETFVNEYKAMNAGKFPPFSYTQKQVGGSYYRIRGILQELQYAAKMSPSGGEVEHSLGREGTRGSESLADVVGDSARIVSEVVDDVDVGVVSAGSSEVKEESMTSSSVEILFEEVVTPDRRSDLDVSQTNMGKEDDVESSYIDPDIVGNDMEEHIKQQSVSTAPGRESLLASEVNSHSRDKYHDSKIEEAHVDKQDFVSEVKHLQIGDTNTASLSLYDKDNITKPEFEECNLSEVMSHSHEKFHAGKREEAQADKHDYISEVKHLQIGDHNTASLSSYDPEDVTEPNLEKCKRKQHEENPQSDQLDPIAAENHVPLEADKVSKDLSGRPAAAAEPPKTTLWGAMKSLADGIISIFRKQ